MLLDTRAAKRNLGPICTAATLGFNPLGAAVERLKELKRA